MGTEEIGASLNVLVVGGGGFLGGALVRRLQSEGHAVRVFSRSAYPELEAQGVGVYRGDIGAAHGDGSSAAALDQAMKRCSGVFHVAARVGTWGAYKDYYATNVQGTANVIAACRRQDVGRLVFTSTPSVVNRGADGGHDIEGGDESLAYGTSYLTHYPRTKAEAERLVLAADSGHDGGGLSTVALRPHLIWGPGDTQLYPRFAAQAKRGRLRTISGPPKLMDTIYIDNAVDAHLLAMQAVRPGAACAGRAYFISNEEPLTLSRIVNGVLTAAGVPLPKKTISPRLAYAVGAMAELVYYILRIRAEPPLTRFVAKQMSCAHWFDISAAKRDLGYSAKVSFAAGCTAFARWLRERDEAAHS